MYLSSLNHMFRANLDPDSHACEIHKSHNDYAYGQFQTLYYLIINNQQTKLQFLDFNEIIDDSY